MADQIITVDLNGLKLDAKQFAAMQAAIRNTTLTELSKLSPTAKPGGFASGIKFIKRPELIGIWVRDLNKAAIEKLEIQV
jgi:hypothetical protein